MSLISGIYDQFRREFFPPRRPRHCHWQCFSHTETCEPRLLLSASDVDTDFDGDGKLVISTSSYPTDLVEEILVRPDGRIITVGSVSYGNGDWDFMVHQRLANGSLDPNFGNGGYKRIAFDQGCSCGFRIWCDSAI
ncbi:MAG: hypothetical protein U0936_11420 [Planctomycetaceae bacterium]